MNSKAIPLENTIKPGDLQSNLIETARKICSFLMDRHGPLLDTAALVSVLRFPTIDAFERSRQRGMLDDLKLLHLPKRRGTFALATDVAAYLAHIEIDSQNPDNHSTGKRRKERITEG